MRKIALTRGQYALVDDADYEAMSKIPWYALPHGKGYQACARIHRDGNKVTLYMARELLKPAAGMVVDHIDNNPLNNQRANLRVCSQARNLQNTSLRSDNKSGFKGVFAVPKSKWVAQINIGGKRRHLGTFVTAEAAARAYDEAAREHYGAFAKLNFGQEALDEAS